MESVEASRGSPTALTRTSAHAMCAVMPRVAVWTSLIEYLGGRRAVPVWDGCAMSFPDGLARSWVSIQVPGTSPPVPATYVQYPSGGPVPPDDVASLEWLKRAPRHPDDYMASAFPSAVLDLSEEAIGQLRGDRQGLPDDFSRFVTEGLRDRLRSATDSYFDLGDSVVEVDGGRLLHVISDSQWVYHWFLYLGDDGGSAVVGTDFPAGFRLDPEDAAFWDEEPWRYVVVADSFAEFLWRWWMDNEIFYTVEVERLALTQEQEAYVRQCGAPRSFS